MQDHGTGHDIQDPPLLHPLVYLEDGEGVTIGRVDTDSYAIFPPDGAQLVRWLADGATVAEAAERYRTVYGESADVEDVIAALDELGFLRAEGEAAVELAPVRWQRLGRALFSAPAWVCYAALVAWALVLVVRSPDLLPRSHDMVFSSYYSVVDVVLLVAVVPLIAVHEAFHALAARRLGVRSRISMSYRFYFLVVETALDGLVAVPRRRRYLPILAGMLADVLVLALLVIAADALRDPGGRPSLGERVCLGVAFATFIRLLWQFFFYIRTDVYVLITTMLGCVDLHTAATRTLRNRANRLLRRPDRLIDETDWHPVDRRIARWYSWLILVGYSVSLCTTVFALAPVFLTMIVASFERFGDGHTGVLRMLDACVFLLLTLTQFLLPIRIAVRDRARNRRVRAEHVVA